MNIGPADRSQSGIFRVVENHPIVFSIVALGGMMGLVKIWVEGIIWVPIGSNLSLQWSVFTSALATTLAFIALTLFLGVCITIRAKWWIRLLGIVGVSIPAMLVWALFAGVYLGPAFSSECRPSEDGGSTICNGFEESSDIRFQEIYHTGLWVMTSP